MRAKKKVGETLPVEDRPRGKGGAAGGHASRGEPGSLGQRDGLPDDARDGGEQRNGQGVLQRPEQLEQVSLRPGDPIKRRGTRPGFIQAEVKQPTSSGWTILRYRVSRAEGSVRAKAINTAEICLPLKKAREMVEKSDLQRKWSKMALESIEDFEALMANPDWLIEERAKRIEQIVGTMHARLTNFKRTLE